MNSRSWDERGAPEGREALLRLLIEEMPAAVAMCDRRMRYIACSRRWITDHGLPNKDLLGKSHYDLLPDLPEHWKVEDQRCLSGETVKPKEGALLRPDGNLDWVRRELVPWIDSTGRIGGLIMVAKVITLQKQTEETLRKSEEKFAKIFRSNPHSTTISAMEDGRYQDVNEAFCRITGWNREELIGRTSADIGLWKDPGDRVRALQIIGKTGRLRNFDVCFVNRKGEEIATLWSAELIELDGRDYLISVVTDISDRKRMERALRESEEKYRLLVENANDAIFIAQEGRIKFPNPRTLDLIGYTAEEIEKSLFVDFIHPDDRELVFDNYRKRLKGERLPSTYSFRIVTKSGEIRVVQINAVRIEWEKKPASLNFIRDITELKKLEEQLTESHKMEAIGMLAGGIAHDFNNLLMGIQGNASLVLMDLSPGHPHYDRLKHIEEHVQSAASITRQLLGFAKGGAYEIKPTDLNQLLQKCAELFGRTKKEIRIHEKYGEKIGAVEVDRSQLEQVMLNIFVNAWQAMPEGGDLFIRTEDVVIGREFADAFKVDSGPYVKVSITDTGIGMDETTKQRIFEPFFTTKEMGRGTGLGLASAYGIIRNHRGFITVSSEEGKGSSFSIYLPRSEREVREDTVAPSAISKGSETILLVDDEKMILEVGTDMLESLGYQVLSADSGEEAITIFKANKDRIGLVLLDMIMPGMSGGEVFDAVRSMDPHVKILLSSGYSLNGQAREILDRGCNGFIQKPFDIKGLSKKVREIFGTDP